MYECVCVWDLFGTAAVPAAGVWSAAVHAVLGHQSHSHLSSHSNTAGRPAALAESDSPEHPAQRESHGKSQEDLQTKGRWKRLPNGSFVSLTACSLTAMHCECLLRAAIPLLRVFRTVPHLSRERWEPPSTPPKPRHRGGTDARPLNRAFTAPLRRGTRERRRRELGSF